MLIASAGLTFLGELLNHETLKTVFGPKCKEMVKYDQVLVNLLDQITAKLMKYDILPKSKQFKNYALKEMDSESEVRHNYSVLLNRRISIIKLIAGLNVILINVATKCFDLDHRSNCRLLEFSSATIRHIRCSGACAGSHTGQH
jgi:hypothetical protein